MLTLFLLCLVYFFAGITDAIGGGGGLLTMPALLLAGVPPHATLGTNKIATMLGSISSLWSYARNGFVEKSIALRGFIAAFVGGLLGSGLAMLCESALLGKILVWLLPVGMVISLVSGRSVFRKEAPLPSGPRLWISVFGIGLTMGFYNGFFGPATGSFSILALHLILHMNLVRASGTAKVFSLASNTASVLMFTSGGVVLFSLAIPCAIADVIGSQLGVWLAVRVGAKVVRFFLFFALILLFISLLFRFILV